MYIHQIFPHISKSSSWNCQFTLCRFGPIDTWGSKVSQTAQLVCITCSVLWFHFLLFCQNWRNRFFIIQVQISAQIADKWVQYDSYDSNTWNNMKMFDFSLTHSPSFKYFGLTRQNNGSMPPNQDQVPEICC